MTFRYFIEKTLIPVNLGYRGIPLPAGRHDVVLRFVPPLWNVGCFATLAAIAAAIALLAKDYWPAFRRDTPKANAPDKTPPNSKRSVDDDGSVAT